MKKIFSLSLLSLFLFTFSANAQEEVTGLSDWEIFLDPGHSGTENMGLYNYSEAEKNLQVAFHLRDILAVQTDIETVYMSRNSQEDNIGLSQRTDLANSLGPDFFLSIHSDAGSPNFNSTLMLYGGWRQNGETVEKTPKGGKRMGDIMDIVLTDAMRINKRGNYADRTFYLGFPANHDNTWPYLSVNRRSNMASLLTEAGFHTSPYQQQRNLNAEYKRLEARAYFWSILDYHEVERPADGIVTGEVSDNDSGDKINGATITAGEQTYTTDTYESLFNEYSSNPDQLSNGFYYLEDFTPGTEQEIIFTAEGYYSDTATVTIKNGDLTFADADLISSIPPFVESSFPGQDRIISPSETIRIFFSRSVSRSSVEKAISVSPEVDFDISWNRNSELRISTDQFDYDTDYVLTIAETANDTSIYKHGLDGDFDGEEGGDFVLNFKTGSTDTQPPTFTSIYPFRATVIDPLPLINVSFSEEINPASVNDETITVQSENGDIISGSTQLYTFKDYSIATFFPSDSLELSTDYSFRVLGDVEDLSGNTIGSDRTYDFYTSDETIVEQHIIDDFDGGLSSWWEPQQSGSTEGIKTLETSRTLNDSTVNHATNSEGAMQLSYGWDTSAPAHLIRLYLNPGTPPQNVDFDNTYTVQAYVFGDGSENRFRFMLRDGSNELEGSPWFTIDWSGWRLVSWDLSADDFVAWVNGDGSFSGDGFVDSFQLTYTEGADENGFVIIDDFRIVQYGVPTSNEEDLLGENGLPNRVELGQNYPNPFNPTTNIEFSLPQNSEVKITLYNISGQKVATIVDQAMSAGTHTVNFDASGLSSGIYIYQMQTANEVVTKKMTLIK